MSNDRVQYSVWSYVLDCLFLSLFLEDAIKNQQAWRIALNFAKSYAQAESTRSNARKVGIIYEKIRVAFLGNRFCLQYVHDCVCGVHWFRKYRYSR